MQQGGMPMQQNPMVQGGMPPSGGPPQAYYPNPNDWLGLNRLNFLKGIYIKQKPQYFENICDRENAYYVYQQAEDGDKIGPKMFKAKEKSGWCVRNCMHPNCRPFDVNVLHEDGPHMGNKIFHYQRECRCTCLCFNRPEMEIIHVENGANERLGKVTEPWYCCDRGIKVFDANDQFTYEVVGGCCQLGFFCPMPCEPCQIIDFDIKNANGEKISAMQKRSPGCVQAALTTADQFTLTFPADADPKKKALLVSSVILMDYAYFENKQKNNNNVDVAVNI
jgi:hypothetical protein